MAQNILRKVPVVKRGMFHYFQTQSGRKLVFFAAGATTLGLFAGNFLPHTLGLNYYKDFVQSYNRTGLPQPVPDKVRARLAEALEVLNVPAYERKLFKPFTVIGFDLFHAGSTKYRFGAALGIPVNYSYASPHDIVRNEIRCRGDESVNWESPSGKLLEQSLILTEKEQIFGLCKSIMQLQTHYVMMNSVFPTVSFLTVYTVGHYLNHRLNLFAKHISVRLVMYSILGMFGMGMWSFMKDFNQVGYDADIDKKLSSLGPQFVEAGLGYYDKILKKNMALRALLGNDNYTAMGNENYLIRQKSMPLTVRKSFFEHKWREMTESAENTSEMPQ